MVLLLGGAGEFGLLLLYYKSIIPLRRPLLKVIKDRSIKDLHYWMLQTRVCVLCSTVLSEIPREVYM